MTLALLALLTASCAQQGVRHARNTSYARPTPLEVPSLVPATMNARTAVQQPDGPATSSVWDRLRGSFEIADCNDDPEVIDWAKRYTARPRHFEDQMTLALPRLVYVQQIAARHRVAGEFVLLPWVESHFRPVHGHRHRPSGMWQIMPATADTLGLQIDENYDARMDVGASTDAVMSLLRRYQDHFGDWRLTDYAYNAGQFAVRRLVERHGAPAAAPAIPALPVRRGTREHLIKLLAIACVVRDPARFHVSLPKLPTAAHLVAVPLHHAMPMAVAARRAALPLDTLRRYNSAPKNDRLDPRHAKTLLLPKDRVAIFLDMTGETSGHADSGDTESHSAHAQNQKSLAQADVGAMRTHKVRPGETLWKIARRYSVRLKQLLHWNGLSSSELQIGQVLMVQAPR